MATTTTAGADTGLASGMASFSLWSQGLGAMMGAIGGYYSAAAQRRNLEAQAAIADANARISELGAQSALAQGQQQIAAQTLQAGQLKSRQRAAMAANGIDMSAGSGAELQASTDLMKEIDKNTLNANAVRSAWGYRAQEANYQNQALMARAGASAISPFTAAATSLLGSAGKVAASWYQFSNAGAFGNPGGQNGYQQADELTAKLYPQSYSSQRDTSVDW